MVVHLQILQELNDALKSRDELKVSALRFLISKINYAKIAKGDDLTDEEVVAEISKEAKRHRESIDAFEKANRQELVQKEKAELEILKKYLPEQLNRDQIAAIVEEAISTMGASSPADFGKVIGAVMGKVKGQADGNIVSQIVKEKLT